MYINNDIDYLKYLVNKTVYIFGAGMRGKACAYKLEKQHIHIAGFIDNDKKLQKKTVDNHIVISIDDFMALNQDNTMIIVCSFYERDIKLQLLEKNIFNFISESQIDFGGGEEYYDEKYFEYQQKIGEFGGKVKKKMFAPIYR